MTFEEVKSQVLHVNLSFSPKPPLLISFLSCFVARGVVSYVRCVITSKGFVLQKPDPIAGSPDAPFRGQAYGSQCVGHVDLAATANGFFPFRLHKATAVH
ncbi:hypothetical protein CDAR_72301 [Caerostris darwini]|uniref:Uncharacterized protein n=1 Tax=Caerostris darwini TaxID=1538125 RepID=A0AAV4MKI8_9ARAC|nr:hypothetical protein CDAR_72301 [Caerostris darwini]